MPAPLGNKNAVRKKRKTRYVSIMMFPEAADALKKIAKLNKTTMSRIIEKSLLATYPNELDSLL